jgi:hypothetical protein
VGQAFSLPRLLPQAVSAVLVPGFPRRLAVILVAVVLGFVFFTVLGQPLFKRFAAGENDFLQLYAGARLVGTPELYDIEASKRIHREVTGTYYPSVYYTRLPWYALVLKPLGSLEYLTAFRIWIGLNVLVVGAWLVTYSWKWDEFPIFAALSLPLLINFANGQDSGLVAAICGFAVLLMRRNRDFAAGALLSLCSIKFHLLFLVPIAVLIHRRWTLLKGALTGAAVLLALSFAADGPGWPHRFLTVITNPELHPGPDHMTTLRNPVHFFTGGDNLLIENALNLGVGALFAYLAWRNRRFEIGFALAMTGGLIVCHHAYSQDLVLQLAALGVIATSEASKAVRAASMLVALPVTNLLLLWGWPQSLLVPLLLLSVLVAAAFADRDDAQGRPRAGLPDP